MDNLTLGIKLFALTVLLAIISMVLIKKMDQLAFKKKLLVFTILIGIIPITLLTLLTYYLSSEALQASIYKGNEAFLVGSISKVEDYFLEREGDAIVLCNSEDIKKSLIYSEVARRDKAKFMQIIKDAYGYTNLYVVDTSGYIKASANESMVGMDLSSEDYLNKALTGEANWSKLFYSDRMKSNIMVYASPILEDGHVLGALVIGIGQDAINELLHDGVQVLGQSGDAYIINKDKLLYTETMLGDYTKNAALVHSIDSKGTDLLTEAIKRKDYEFKGIDTYLDYLGNPVLGAVGVAQLGAEYVGMVIEVDVSEAMGLKIKLRNIIFSLLLINIVLMFAVAAMIVKAIIKPVNSVNRMLKDINEGEGDLTKRLHIVTKDEFGELGTLFNNFIIRLQNEYSRKLGPRK